MAEEYGEVSYVDGYKIEVKNKKGEVTTYRLNKFNPCHCFSCINQRPLVTLGEKIKKGQALTDMDLYLIKVN